LYRELFFDSWKEYKALNKGLDYHSHIKEVYPEIYDNEESRILLGSDLIYFLEQRCDIFKIIEVRVEKKWNRAILPTKEFDTFVNNITLLECDEMPMIIKPVEWVLDSKGRTIEYGGTLTNKEYRVKGLISSSHKNWDSKKIFCSQLVVNTVNKLASVPYTINTELLDIISSRKYYINSVPLIRLDLHKETHNLSNLINTKNFSMVKEITSHNSKYIQDRSIITFAKLLTNTDKFYLTTFLDWRGRIYTSSIDLNYQGSELARSLILFNNGEVLNEHGLEALKIYTANAWGLDKKSKVDRLSWVEENLKRIITINNDDNDLWLQADEPLIFLACSLELRNYMRGGASSLVFFYLDKKNRAKQKNLLYLDYQYY
jgi:DNA-directed RNA polymerase